MSEIKSLQRMLVVQALYQSSINKSLDDEPIESMFLHIVESLNMNKLKKKSNFNFAKTLYIGVKNNSVSIDYDISTALGSSHDYGKIEKLLRSIFQVAVYELNYGVELPKKVIISEYLKISDSFYSEKETSLVNGVLDNIKRK